MSEYEALEGIPTVADLVEVQTTLKTLTDAVMDNNRATAVLLSGLLPGGIIHDRVAEVRAAVKELASNPGQDHSAASAALMKLNWGSLGVEE